MKLSNGCNHLFHILSHIQQILEYGLCNTHLSCRMTHIILSSFNENAPNLDHPNLDPFKQDQRNKLFPEVWHPSRSLANVALALPLTGCVTSTGEVTFLDTAQISVF